MIVWLYFACHQLCVSPLARFFLVMHGPQYYMYPGKKSWGPSVVSETARTIKLSTQAVPRGDHTPTLVIRWSRRPIVSPRSQEQRYFHSSSTSHLGFRRETCNLGHRPMDKAMKIMEAKHQPRRDDFQTERRKLRAGHIFGRGPPTPPCKKPSDL